MDTLFLPGTVTNTLYVLVCPVLVHPDVTFPQVEKCHALFTHADNLIEEATFRTVDRKRMLYAMSHGSFASAESG